MGEGERQSRGRENEEWGMVRDCRGRENEEWGMVRDCRGRENEEWGMVRDRAEGGRMKSGGW